MTDDSEIAWHREQIAKNHTLLEELEAGNTAGSDVFPEIQSEIEIKGPDRSITEFRSIRLQRACWFPTALR
jgi:hypothetical protein